MEKFNKAGLQGFDAYISAFSSNNFANDFFNWGTIFGGDGGEYVGDLSTYKYKGKDYLLFAGSSSSKKGTVVSNNDDYPVVYKAGSFYRRNNNSNSKDIVISRLEITNANISVSEHKSQNSHLIIYPNPSNSIVNIQSYDIEIREVELLNSAGKCVLRRDFIASKGRQESIELDLTGLTKGVYMIIINNVINGKIVKI